MADELDALCVRSHRVPELVTETIANPLLRVADIAALAELAGQHQARLLVDNTFASPGICQPLAWGADLVMESITIFATLSHPASTSHRGLTPPGRMALGIEDGTIRLSVGCEPVAGILQLLDDAIQAAVA